MTAISVAVIALLYLSVASAQFRSVPLLEQRLSQWSANIPGFDSTRYTLVGTMTLESCTPCAVSSINSFLASADNVGLSVNRMVVILSREPKEGLSLRKKFKTTNVSEENSDQLFADMGAGRQSPDGFLVSPDGRIVCRRADLPRHPFNEAEFADLASHFDLIRHIKPSRISPLLEDDDHILSSAQCVDLDSVAGQLRLFDSRSGTVATFDLWSGKRLGEGVVFDSLGYYFMATDADTGMWHDLARHYSQMVKIDGIVRSNRFDTTEYLAELFTGYTSMPRPQGGTNIGWEKSICLIRACHDSVVDVLRLPVGRYYPAGTPVRVRSRIIAQSLWEGSFVENDSLDTDSLRLLVRITPDGSDVTADVPVAELLSSLAGRYRAKSLGSISATASGAILCVNRVNRMLVRATLEADRLSARRMPFGGIFSDLDGLQGTYPLDSSRTAPLSDSLAVLDLRNVDDREYLLAYDKRPVSANSPLLLQTYTDAGQFVDVMIIDSDIHGDEFLSGHIAGASRNELIILTKWRKARWQIIRVPFVSLTK